MKRFAFLYILALGGLQALQAFLGLLDSQRFTTDESKTGILFHIFDNRLMYIPVLALFVSIVPVVGQYFLVPRKVKHELRTRILNIMLNNIFERDRETRITIFKDVWWIRVFWVYLKENVKHPIDWYYGKNKYFYPRFGKYIKVSERVGTENPKSKTYFLVSEKTWKECEGVGAVARQIEGEQIAENLPDISHICLDNINIEQDTADARLVKQYMEESFIQNVNTLKRLHIKARHFYANILVDKNAKIVAVLVIDSNNEDSPLNDFVLSKINGYVELFSSTF